MANAALSPDEAASVVGRQSGSKAELLGRAVEAVTSRLAEACGPIIALDIEDEVHDGGGSEIWLRYRPVIEVIDVTEYAGTTSTALTIETPGVVPGYGYLLDRFEHDPTLYSGVVRRRAGGSDTPFLSGRANVVFNYRAGRAENTESVPALFKEAAAITLKNWWRTYEASTGNVDEFTVPQQSFPTFAIPKAVREMLEHHWQELPGIA